MKKKVPDLTSETDTSTRESAEFVTATRVTRQAFLTTLRDLADTRAEMKAMLPTGPNILLPHDSYLVRSYLEKMLKGAAALCLGLRVEEAHAVLAAADLIIELSRSEELRAEMAQALNDYERQVAEIRRDLDGLNDAERSALRKLIEAIERDSS